MHLLIHFIQWHFTCLVFSNYNFTFSRFFSSVLYRCVHIFIVCFTLTQLINGSTSERSKIGNALANQVYIIIIFSFSLFFSVFHFYKWSDFAAVSIILLTISILNMFWSLLQSLCAVRAIGGKRCPKNAEQCTFWYSQIANRSICARIKVLRLIAVLLLLI